MNLGFLINSGANEAAPHLSRDGQHLFFTSNRPGGLGSNDLWVSRRVQTHDDFGWETPVNLGPPINGPSFDAGATSQGPEFYFTSNRESSALDVYLSIIGRHGLLGGASRVVELSSEGNDQRPSIRFDGLEIFLSSDRAGSIAGTQDIWVSTRRNHADAWSEPLNAGLAINSEFQDQQPGISGDGRILFFGSDRPGGSGGLDLYVATRVPEPGPRR